MTISGKIRAFVVLTMVLVLISSLATTAQEQQTTTEPEAKAPTKLAVLWTSGDPDVAYKVCFMYTYNAKKLGWFDEVTLIVWGPSARLLAADKSLQEYIAKMKEIGIKLEACYYCADMYGVVEDLKALGVDVKGMGTVLTEYLQTDWKVLTF